MCGRRTKVLRKVFEKNFNYSTKKERIEGRKSLTYKTSWRKFKRNYK